MHKFDKFTWSKKGKTHLSPKINHKVQRFATGRDNRQREEEKTAAVKVMIFNDLRVTVPFEEFEAIFMLQSAQTG